MISISFFLRTPDALHKSKVYVSISNKKNRLKFATGVEFLTAYCNIRKRKGGKGLIKANSKHYLEYKNVLDSIISYLINIESELEKKGEKPSLVQIRDAFYLQSGKTEAEPSITFDQAYNLFLTAKASQWGAGTRKHWDTLKKHILEFETTYGKIEIEKMNEDFWKSFRDDFLVEIKKMGNATANKYLDKLKYFIKYAVKKEWIKVKVDYDEFIPLDEIEPYKIVLKLPEVEKLIALDLSDNTDYDKVRDLFALEIFTGQRFSDLHKTIDAKNISEKIIEIYQEKGNERVAIPIHPKLKKHLSKILKKYPKGLPSTTNQEFNKCIKLVGELAGFNKEHSWTTLTGKRKINHTDFRYNLISSHTGRRVFCTLALKEGIPAEIIMRITGHKSYTQFIDYIKVDDADLGIAFEKFLTKKTNK